MFALAYQKDRVTGTAMVRRQTPPAERVVDEAVPPDTVDQRIDWAAVMAIPLVEAGTTLSFRVYDPETAESRISVEVGPRQRTVVPAGTFETARIVYRIDKSRGSPPSHAEHAWPGPGPAGRDVLNARETLTGEHELERSRRLVARVHRQTGRLAHPANFLTHQPLRHLRHNARHGVVEWTEGQPIDHARGNAIEVGLAQAVAAAVDCRRHLALFFREQQIKGVRDGQFGCAGPAFAAEARFGEVSP
jgi:hypothetical protein